MGNHELSQHDRDFIANFEACRYATEEFDHRAHVRLAYAYLAERDTEAAVTMMRNALVAFLHHHGIDAARYHETLTRAWVMAVRHFMQKSPGASSAEAFIMANPQLLDSKIMLTHYSAEVLFSSEARARFVEPDVDHIPGHDG